MNSFGNWTIQLENEIHFSNRQKSSIAQQKLKLKKSQDFQNIW